MTVLPQSSRMPEGMEIQVRNRQFNLQKHLGADWLDKDPFKTAFFNSMSMSFPVGEKSFIDSVRAFSDKIDDPKLKKEMSGFFGQEGMHRREHQKYNEVLCEQRGYDLDKLEARWIKRVEQLNKRGKKIIALGGTVAAEHFTAILAEKLLMGWQMDNLPAKMKELWLWHASEELEHKSVAFDVYEQMGGSFGLRKMMLRIFTYHFFKDLLSCTFSMLRHDKQLWKWKTLKSGVKFMFGKGGFIRELWPQYKVFYKAGFHPWNHDNSHLLDLHASTEQVGLEKPA